MNLSEKAVLLGQLGRLMRCLAFTQTQFERVKTLILNGDPRVTVELFSTLTAFREQRAAGILTDQEYNDLVSEGLEDLMVDLDPSSTDAPTTVSSSYQASKRKRSDAAGRERSGVQKRRGNVESSFSSIHPAGSSCSQDGHQQPTNSSQRHVVQDETSCGLEQDIDRRKIVLSGILASNKPDEKLSEVGDNQIVRRCSNRTGGRKNSSPSVTSKEPLCFIWQRWTQTNPFTLPHGSGYCTDEGPLTIVDSTVDLLERAIPRPFPLYIGSSNSFKGSPPKVSFQKQATMYCKLKKVLIRLGEKEEEIAVYRATDKEVEKEVNEVSRKKMTVEEYILGVKRLRAGQQGS